MQTAIIPSIMTSGRLIDVGALEMGLERRGRRNHAPVPRVVEFDNQTFLAGDGVWEHTQRPVERLDLASLGNGQFGRVMAYAAIGSALQPGTYRDVRILTGLPVQVLANRAQAERIVASLRSWLVGRHRFSVDGAAFDIAVSAVGAMAQPLGGFFAWAYRLGDPDALRSTVAVLDPGFNTLDLYVIRNLQVSPIGTTGDTIGVHQAAKKVADEIYRLTGARISLRQADSLLRMKRLPKIRRTDLRPIVEAAKADNAAQIIQAVRLAWANLVAEAYIATGGGTAMYTPYIQRALPDVEILPEPATANARGLAQYARRQRWKDAELVIGLDPGFGAYKVAVE